MTESNDGMLRKIQGLLSKAAASEFEGEREAFRAKADELMVKYAIEQYHLDEAREARGEQRILPTTRPFFLPYNYDGWADVLNNLLGVVMYQTGCRKLYKESGNQDGGWGWFYTLIGYEAEISYAEMLFMSLQLQLLGALEPHADKQKTFAENVYILHEAGYPWDEVISKLNAVWFTVPADKVWRQLDRSKRDRDFMWRQYIKHCKLAGTEPRKEGRPRAYRDSFANAFVWQVQRRMRDQRGDAVISGALELKSRADEVEKLFQSLIPVSEEIVEEEDTGKKKRVAKVKVVDLWDPAGNRAGVAAGNRADFSDPSSRLGRAAQKGVNA